MTERRPNKWSDLEASMRPEARARVRAKVQATLATMPLAEIRKAVGMTQSELAGSLDVAQGSVSKLERQADMYLSTLRKYVHALGGELHLTAEFPDGRKIEIERLAELSVR